MVGGALVLAEYCIYAFGRYSSGAIAEGNLKFWAGTMLVFIGIGIVVTIVLQIVFHIALSIGIAVKDRACDEKEIDKRVEATVIEDEMDKLIELKSSQIGFVLAGVGFVGALILLVLGYSTVVMLNVMYLSFLVGSLVEGAASLYFYGKGVSNA
jgi:Na+-transporting methylmalonyl-CoA/oxaloacetate decarboxylase gamma subunit